LLFEAKWDDLADEIWVTVTPPEIVAERVSARSNLTVEAVMERIRSQMTNEQRTERADVVIDTSGDMDSTREQAQEQWEKLRRRLGS